MSVAISVGQKRACDLTITDPKQESFDRIHYFISDVSLCPFTFKKRGSMSVAISVGQKCACDLTITEQGSGGWQNFLGQAALSGQHLASQSQSASVRHSSTQKNVSPLGSGAGHDPGLGGDTDGKHTYIKDLFNTHFLLQRYMHGVFEDMLPCCSQHFISDINTK